MAEFALTFNEHDIHLITKELQGSPDNTPVKNTLFNKKDLQSDLLEYKPDFCNININDILDSCQNKPLTKSQILLILIILGNFKPKNDIKIKSTSKYFWLQILKCKIFRVNKLYKVNMQKIYQLIEEHKNEINNNQFLK